MILALADSLDKSHFLLTLYSEVQPECKHHYKGLAMAGYKSWVTRACLLSKYYQIKLQDSTENSLLLENEQLVSLVEVTKDRLVIHVFPKDILLV